MLTKLNRFRMGLLGRPLLVALLFLPYFEPGMATQYIKVDWIFVFIKGISMLCIVACFLARPRVSLLTAAIGAYQALVLIIMFIKHSDGGVSRWVFDSASIATICLLVDQVTDADPKAAVGGLFYVLGALCVINLATVLIFPGGMSYAGKPDSYFLGLDNSNGFFIIPLLPVALLYAWDRGWPWWAQAGLLALFSLSLYITWTVTGMLAATAFIVLFLLYQVKGSSLVCNIGVYYAGLVLLFLLLVVFQVTDRFAFLIEGVLHKTVSLSGRLPIWKLALDQVKASPWLGHGFSSNVETWVLTGAINCHNFFLQCLFDTGLVGTAVFAAGLGTLVRPLMKLRRDFVGYVLAAGVFTFLLMVQGESPVGKYQFYMFLILAANGEKIAAALGPGKKAALGGSET